MSDMISGAADWSLESEAGLRCGIFGCFAAKTVLAKCRICTHRYCPEHLDIHESAVPHVVNHDAFDKDRPWTPADERAAIVKMAALTQLTASRH